MRLHCNKYWPGKFAFLPFPLLVLTITVKDNEQKLFAEMIQRALNPEYDDLLGLPFVVEFENPHRACFGKARHVRAMFSGWIIEESSDPSERDDSQNILLLESTTSNTIKWDIEEEYCHEAIRQLKQIHVPLELYNPSLSPPSFISTSATPCTKKKKTTSSSRTSTTALTEGDDRFALIPIGGAGNDLASICGIYGVGMNGLNSGREQTGNVGEAVHRSRGYVLKDDAIFRMVAISAGLITSNVCFSSQLRGWRSARLTTVVNSMLA